MPEGSTVSRNHCCYGSGWAFFVPEGSTLSGLASRSALGEPVTLAMVQATEALRVTDPEPTGLLGLSLGGGGLEVPPRSSEAKPQLRGLGGPGGPSLSSQIVFTRVLRAYARM